MSVSTGQGCSNTELTIVGNKSKLIYLFSRITNAALTFGPHYIQVTFSLYSYRRNSRSHTSHYTRRFPETSQRN